MKLIEWLRVAHPWGYAGMAPKPVKPKCPETNPEYETIECDDDAEPDYDWN